MCHSWAAARLLRGGGKLTLLYKQSLFYVWLGSLKFYNFMNNKTCKSKIYGEVAFCVLSLCPEKKVRYKNTLHWWILCSEVVCVGVTEIIQLHFHLYNWIVHVFIKNCTWISECIYNKHTYNEDYLLFDLLFNKNFNVIPVCVVTVDRCSKSFKNNAHSLATASFLYLKTLSSQHEFGSLHRSFFGHYQSFIMC